MVRGGSVAAGLPAGPALWCWRHGCQWVSLPCDPACPYAPPAVPPCSQSSRDRWHGHLKYHGPTVAAPDQCRALPPSATIVDDCLLRCVPFAACLPCRAASLRRYRTVAHAVRRRLDRRAHRAPVSGAASRASVAFRRRASRDGPAVRRAHHRYAVRLRFAALAHAARGRGTRTDALVSSSLPTRRV